jgi:predicted membrane protein
MLKTFKQSELLLWKTIILCINSLIFLITIFLLYSLFFYSLLYFIYIIYLTRKNGKRCQQKEHDNQIREKELNHMVLEKECLPKMAEEFWLEEEEKVENN